MGFSICALDDDESILYTLEAMSHTQAWEFRGTTSVEQCLDWVRQGAIDILLLDYHMPCENGLDVLNKIKRLSPSLPVLILTIEQEPKIAEALLVAGADDFINKPVRLADFLARIGVHRRLHPRRKTAEKGIGREKLQRVIAFLRTRADPVDIEAVASECGMSYTTTHRYLDHLVKNGLVTTAEVARHGKLGRPTRSYLFIGIGSSDGGE